MSDEEPVRSAAALLTASKHFWAGRRTEAFAVLDALSGHDRRFAPAITELKGAVSAGKQNTEAVLALEKVLTNEDASAAPIASAVCDLLAQSSGSGSPTITARAAARAMHP